MGLSEWEFPDPEHWYDNNDLVTAGADLAPGTLIHAYSSGLFPMDAQFKDGKVLAWWSPLERGVLPLDGLVVSRSLRKSIATYETRIDTCFADVILRCANLPREGTWITDEFVAAYIRLFELGYAHSVETFRDGELVGGLYGVRIGAFFAGESMFHTATDASKVALCRLVDEMNMAGMKLLDVQWQTPHLATLGVIEVPRLEYLQLLDKALGTPSLGWQ